MRSRRYDPTVTSNVLGADLVAAGELGLKNVDRVVPLLIPATTPVGKDYSRAAEMYYALVAHRYRMVSAVAKIVGGVEEMRYHGGRGGIPFQPVAPERQRQAVRFLIDNVFVTPTTLLDPDVTGRIEPASADDALQGTNVRLLQQLLTPGVFNRMAEASAGKAGKQAYYGLDLLEDLNKGLFSELAQDQPFIDPYRRQLQRNYITAMLVANGDVSDPESAERGITRNLADEAGQGGWDGETALQRGRAGAAGGLRKLVAGRDRHAVPRRRRPAERDAWRSELGARGYRREDRRRPPQGEEPGNLGPPPRPETRGRPRALMPAGVCARTHPVREFRTLPPVSLQGGAARPTLQSM